MIAPNRASNRCVQKQRQKQKVTGSSSRIIEVWVCPSSERFQVATLSEQAPDEVSQGGEWAVITGRLERRSISETALRGVRRTRRSCWHAKRAGYKQIEQPCWQTTIQKPFSVTFFPLWFALSSQRGLGVREPFWQVYLNIYADKEKTRMLSPTTDSATRMNHLLPKTPPSSSKSQLKKVFAEQRLEMKISWPLMYISILLYKY